MKINSMLEIVKMSMWERIRFVEYTYSGHDGRRVTKWILHLGFFRLIKYRIGN